VPARQLELILVELFPLILVQFRLDFSGARPCLFLERFFDRRSLLSLRICSMWET